jgi:REP-associated tyrosine transposase
MDCGDPSPLWLSGFRPGDLVRLAGGEVMSDHDKARRFRAIEQLITLSPDGLAEVEALLRRLQGVSPPRPERTPPGHLDWPHAPPHRISEFGTYFVTTGTLHRQHYFAGPERLDHLHSELLARARDGNWQLEAWAVFSNHYHFVAHALPEATPLGVMLKELHRTTSIFVNRLDRSEGRQTWFNFRETALTHEGAYYARLAYVHNNPVKHGLVTDAREYRWCSASWFERSATPAQVATMARIKTDAVKVYDDYDPI